MTAPVNPLTIRVPEIAGCRLSTTLYVIAEALTSDEAMTAADRADLVASLEILAADARRLERKVEAVNAADAAMQRLGVV